MERLPLIQSRWVEPLSMFACRWSLSKFRKNGIDWNSELLWKMFTIPKTFLAVPSLDLTVQPCEQADDKVIDLPQPLRSNPIWMATVCRYHPCKPPNVDQGSGLN